MTNTYFVRKIMPGKDQMKTSFHNKLIRFCTQDERNPPFEIPWAKIASYFINQQSIAYKCSVLSDVI